jgi:serine/threonine protein kinase
MYSSPTDSQALPAGTHLLEFVIERVLGAGGFGITYLAKDTSLSRKVVIKENMPTQFAWRDSTSGTVRPRHSTGSDVEDYEWSMKNFLREAETLASLDHPSIVKVLRQFEANGTAYFVMPYVEGLALDELAKQRVDKPFCEEELRGLLERMLDALAYLHDRGIYHRDIKPANILISNQGMPAMIDFGSARQRLSERSMTVVESAGFTPFEQLQTRGNVGPWSDLYALAATLVKVMTGEAPPKANDRSFGDPWQPLAVRQELLGRYSARFLECLDRALRLPIQERWQNSEQWKMTMREETDVELPREVKPMLKPTIARTSRAFKSANNTEKKAKYIPWIVGACVLFSLLVVARSLMEQAQANGGMPIESSDGGILKDPKAGDEREFEIAPGVQMTFC